MGGCAGKVVAQTPEDGATSPQQKARTEGVEIFTTAPAVAAPSGAAAAGAAAAAASTLTVVWNGDANDGAADETCTTAKLFWVDMAAGVRNWYADIPVGSQHVQGTYVGHVWVATRGGDEIWFASTRANQSRIELDWTQALRSSQPPEQGQAGAKINAKHASPPPMAGTVWFTTKLYTAVDPTAFAALTHRGKEMRHMFDRRSESFDDVEAHVFDAAFGQETKRTIEVQVNSTDFATPSVARQHAETYAHAIGKLPSFLLEDVDTVWIHAGCHGFGGGNRNLLIHTDQGEKYIEDDVLEECFVHESTHTSFDSKHAASRGWVAAREEDGAFLSAYAQEHPAREDLAETMGPYLAARFRADRLEAEKRKMVLSTIPARCRYLDALNLNLDIIR